MKPDTEPDWSDLKMMAETAPVKPKGSKCGCVPWTGELRFDHDGGQQVSCLSCGALWVEWIPGMKRRVHGS